MCQSFLEHCQNGINNPKLKTYHKLYGNNYYYSDMCRLYDQYKQRAQKKNNQPQEINLTPKVPATVFNGSGPGPDKTAQQNSGIATNNGKNLKLSEIVAKIREKYTPKISTTEQNQATNNCANEPALPALPEVKPVELPDKGGCINTPELPNQGSICPTPANEPFPKSCGTGQLPVVIPEGLNLPPQTMPSLGGGMGLGDNNNPPEPAPEAPNPEPGKVTEVKPESKTEEANKEKEKQNKPTEAEVDAEKVKKEEFEIAIGELKKLYGEDIVNAAIEINKDMTKYANSDVIISIEQTTKDLLKINSNERWKLFKYEQGNVNLKLTRKNLEEALTGIAAEEQKFLNDLRRSSNSAEEFIDSNGFAWDVKTAKSRLPNGKAIFKETDFVESVKKEFRIGERVIIDITQLEKSDLDKLLKRLSSQLNAEEIEKTLIIHRTNPELSKKLGGYIGLLP